MRGNRTILLIIAGVLILCYLFVWPVVEQELMKIPVVDAINAVRGGDVAALRACFTPDATMGYGELRIPADLAIEAMAPLIASGRGRGTLRFGGYMNLTRRSSRLAETDAAVWVHLEGGELPYRSVPLRKTGHVWLERQGLFTWKIKRLTSEEPEFDEAIRGGDLER